MPIKKSNLRQSVLYRCAALITGSNKNKLAVLVAAQILVSSLDLLGVLIIGAVGALAVLGFESHHPSAHVSALLKDVGLSGYSSQTQVAVLASAAAIFLILRSVLSIYLTRRIMRFFIVRGAILAGNMAQSLFNQPLLALRERTEKESIYAITTGVEEITVKILSPIASAISDASLLVFLAVGLLIVQPLIAACAGIFFLAIVYVLHRFVGERSRILGRENARVGIRSSEEISSSLSTFRELFVRNQLPHASFRISESRKALADIQTEMAFLPNIGKYVMESSIVVGALIISGLQFAVSNGTHAVATLAIFLTASTRIAPALLRIQQGVNQYRSSIGAAERTLDLASALQPFSPSPLQREAIYKNTHPGFVPRIEIKNLVFTYPNAKSPSVGNISLTVESGDLVGVVGPSGAGKTTLVDLILGLINPDGGSVLLSGLTPREAITKWPGAIAYVPQDVEIINGTLRENLALGYDLERIQDSDVQAVITAADLGDFVRELPQGLETVVGETGLKLSGGQKQRLAIARALISRPELLVMDEATSALDAETENNISSAITSLKGRCTVIMIAHRLSSIRNATKVVYIENGQLAAAGNFSEVRAKIKDFDRQAKLMGL